jgi:hypothetical protein
MLDSGNDKLNEAMKQLVNIRACKEKLQGKLMKAQGTLTEMQCYSSSNISFQFSFSSVLWAFIPVRVQFQFFKLFKFEFSSSSENFI